MGKMPVNAQPKTKETILNDYRTVMEIGQKNGVQMSSLAAECETLATFRVTVPVIGACNTGKSALLNALMGAPLLPTSILAKTLVPTELAYGENALVIDRNGVTQNAGLGELRGDYLDMTDVTSLQVSYPSAWLKELDKLCVVDMPGIDADMIGSDSLIYRYIAQSLGYVLVVSAEEPVLKDSVCKFLSELRLRDIPFYILLTKCDKVTDTEREQGVRFFCKLLRQQFQLENVPIACVQTKVLPDIAPAAQIFRVLNRAADVLCYSYYGDKLSHKVEDMIAILQVYASRTQATVREIERRTESLRERSAHWEQAIAYWEQDVLRVMRSLKKPFLTQASAKVEDFAPVLEADVLSRTIDAEKSMNELLSLIVALVKSELEPVFQKQLRSLQAMMIYHLAQDGGEEYVNLVRSFERWNADCSVEGALYQISIGKHERQTLISCCIAQMRKTEMEPLLGAFYARSFETQRQNVSEAVKTELLPQILSEMRRGVGNGLELYSRQLCNDVRSLVAGRCQEIENRLAQMIAACGDQTVQEKQSLTEIEKDIVSLQEILVREQQADNA